MTKFLSAKFDPHISREKCDALLLPFALLIDRDDVGTMHPHRQPLPPDVAARARLGTPTR